MTPDLPINRETPAQEPSYEPRKIPKNPHRPSPPPIPDRTHPVADSELKHINNDLIKKNDLIMKHKKSFQISTKLREKQIDIETYVEHFKIYIIHSHTYIYTHIHTHIYIYIYLYIYVYIYVIYNIL